jgi:hypothetical protein
MCPFNLHTRRAILVLATEVKFTPANFVLIFEPLDTTFNPRGISNGVGDEKIARVTTEY